MKKLLAIWLFSAIVFSAYADDTGYQNPTANTGNWATTPTNAYADGGGTASAGMGGDQAHKYYTYGFSVTGTVDSITIRVDALKGGATPPVCSLKVRLSWNNGTSWTSYEYTPALTTSEVTYELGGDDWGHSWSLVQVNDSFKVEIMTIGNSIMGGPMLDWIPAKIYYTSISIEQHPTTIDENESGFSIRDSVWVSGTIDSTRLYADNDNNADSIFAHYRVSGNVEQTVDTLVVTSLDLYTEYFYRIIAYEGVDRDTTAVDSVITNLVFGRMDGSLGASKYDTDTEWQEKTHLNIYEAGAYIILATFEAGGTGSGQQPGATYVKLLHDDAEFNQIVRTCRGGTDYYWPAGWMRKHSIDAGDKLRIMYRTSVADDNEVRIRNVRILAIDVDAIAAWEYNEIETQFEGHDTSWLHANNIRATISWTPGNGSEWLVMASQEIRPNTCGECYAQARLSRDDEAEVLDVATYETNDYLDYLNWLSFRVFTFSDGNSHKLEIQVRSDSIGIMNSRHSRILAIKLDDSWLDSWGQEEDNTEDTTTSTTYDSLLTLTHTPDDTIHTLVLSSLLARPASSTIVSHYRAFVDGTDSVGIYDDKTHDATDYVCCPGMGIFEWTPTLHTAKIQWCGEAGNKYINYARVIALSVIAKQDKRYRSWIW